MCNKKQKLNISTKSDRAILPDFNQNYDDKRLNNLYNVLENHTYKKRWKEILDRIGFDYADDADDVSVVYRIDDEEKIEKVIDNFNAINYPRKNLKILAPDEINIKGKYPQITGIYRESEISTLKNKIDSEYWILSDGLIGSDFIKKAVLHYQYLNKRLAVGCAGEIFKITREKSIENKLFNRINLDYMTRFDEIDVYSIDGRVIIN